MIAFVLIIFNLTSGKIQGCIIDEATNEPIEYVNVCILKTEIGTATDEKGNFFILNVPPDHYTIEISCLGYQTQQIEEVSVKADQTIRLDVKLKPALIEMPPVTVTKTAPVVDRDWVGTTYIIRKTEIMALPIDFTEKIIALQPAVANVDTALHVRGGRATEVSYLIDNVSIIDPQTGDPAIIMSKDIIDEVLFMPCGFDAEYGHAMSGVVNLITERPGDKIKSRVFGKTETFMPWYYDFGYSNGRATLQLPISKRLRTMFNFDLMHTDDWDPRLFKLPRKQRDDYALYGKLLCTISPNLNMGFTIAGSRSQFDRYHHKFKYWLDHYRSDWRKSNLEIINLNYLPKNNILVNATLSRLFTHRIFGVRESGPYGLFDDFKFRDYQTLKYPQPGFMNPFGVYIRYFRIEGDYWEYQDKSSLVMNAKVNTQYQISKREEIKAGIDYSYLDLKNFAHRSGDSLARLDDEYDYKPFEFSGYIQNNLDLIGLFIKTGCRVDHYINGIDSVPTHTVLSPRIGLTFIITNNTLFRTNIGRYIQPAYYEKYYDYYGTLPLPTWTGTTMLVGNPMLQPEKTIAYEMGFQGIVRKNLVCNINAFYKNVTDLLGTRFVRALPKSYVSYFNVEYAQIKGTEFVVDYQESFFTGKLSYTLSWAKGTSSYAEEVYSRYYSENQDTLYVPEAFDYNLDFDQRHRVLLQGEFTLPASMKLFILNFWGNGFPYTPPGEEGKTEVRNLLRFTAREQLDCMASKAINIGKTNINITVEAINLFNNRYQIAVHQTWVPMSNLHHDDFDDYLSITDHYYHPAADLNHDGIVSPSEEFTSFREILKETDDWIGSYSSPRRVRLGISCEI